MIKIIEKIFYCRYCDTPSKYCFSQHRSGLYFKYHVTIPPYSATVVAGEGENEGTFPFNLDLGDPIRVGMSGCVDYRGGHKTMSNWCFLTRPYVVEVWKEGEKSGSDYQEIELNETEKIVASRQVRDVVRAALFAIAEKYGEIPELPVEYAHFLPLLKTFLRSRTIPLPNGAWIEEEGKSWKSEFRLREISFSIPKGRVEITDSYVEGTFAVQVANREIYYSSNGNHHVVYMFVKHPYQQLYGYEQYGDHIHPPAEINERVMIDDLFKRRLGDLMFHETETIHEHIFRRPVKNSISKIKVINGKFECDGETVTKIIPENPDEETVLYHPEHGTLVFKGERYVYTVPYIRAGHD